MVDFNTPEEELAWVIEVSGDDDGILDESEMMTVNFHVMDLVQAEFD